MARNPDIRAAELRPVGAVRIAGNLPYGRLGAVTIGATLNSIVSSAATQIDAVAQGRAATLHYP